MSTDEELAFRLKQLSSEFPTLYSQMPGVTYAVAQGPDFYRTAAQSESLREALFIARNLRRYDVDHQFTLFGSYDKATQERLKAVGYQTPEKSDPNFFESIVGRPVGWVLGGTLGNVVEFANKAAAGTWGNIQHWYRTKEFLDMEHQRMQGEDPFDIGFGESWGTLFSSADAWSRAWEATKEGNRFLPFGEDRLREHGIKVSADTFAVARDMALEFSEPELIAVYGEQALEAFEDPSFKRAVEVLSDSKISFGRGVARGLGIREGTKPFDVVSGASDGLGMWFADPFNAVPIGKIRAARLGMMEAASAQHVFAASKYLPKIQRGIGFISDTLTTAEKTEEGLALAAGTLTRQMPRLSPFVDELVQSKAETYDEVTGFFANKAFEVSWSEGRYGKGFSMADIGQSRIDRFWATHEGDALSGFTKFARQNGAEPVANFLNAWQRRLASLNRRVPKADSFNPESEEAFDFVRGVASISVGGKGLTPEQIRQRMDAWSAASLGGKRKIYTGLLEEMRGVLGQGNKQIQQYFDTMLEKVSASDFGQGRRYGDDIRGFELGTVVREDGSTARYGILDYQILDTRWAVPDFRELAQAHKVVSRLTYGKGGWIPQGWVNSFMDNVWRRGKVLTLSQGFRQGTEEIVGYAVENGWMPTFRARLSATAARRAQGKRGPLVNYLATAAKVATRSTDDVGFVDAANDLIDLQGARMLPDLLDPHSRDIIDHLPALKKALSSSGTVKRYRLQPGGLYKTYGPGSEIHDVIWQSRFADMSKSAQTKVALRAFVEDADPEEAMLDWLKRPEQERLRKASAIVQELGEDAGLSKLASESVEAVRSLTHTPDGVAHRSLIGKLLRGKVPDLEDLSAIPENLRPVTISARAMTPVAHNAGSVVEAVSDWGFDLIDRQMRWVSREPMMIAEYARLKKLLAPQIARAKASGIEGAEELLKRNIMDRAAQEVYRHVDDPRVRTQFAQAHRALFPFWYAQDLFIRRWGKRLMRDPGAARRALLTLNGLEHSGVTERDENGDLVFHFPMVGPAMWAVRKGLSAITGNEVFNSLGVGFTGKVKYLAPGLGPLVDAVQPGPSKSASPVTDAVRPGVGPFLSIATGILHSRFPEIIAPIQGITEGEFSNQSVWRTLAPTIAAKLFTTFDQEQRTSLVMQAIQQLDASAELNLDAALKRRKISRGAFDLLPPEEQEEFRKRVGADLALGEFADEAQREQYLDRIRSSATYLGVIRGIFGFTAPGGPQLEFAGDLQPEFIKYLKTMPIEEASAAFLRRHPEASAWTIFQTQVAGGARKPLEPTAVAGEFWGQNKEFFDRHGVAATWFLPESPEGFDPVVYRQQLASGLRIQKAPEQFWMEVKRAAAAPLYYQQRAAYLESVKGLMGPAKEFEDQRWLRWKTMYLAQHPALEQHVFGGALRQLERRQTLAGLIGATQDPSAPKVAHGAELGSLLARWQTYQRQADALKGRRDYVAQIQRKQLDQQFLTFGDSLSSQAVRSLFDANIRPELDDGGF